jgi:hypothetical protein
VVLPVNEFVVIFTAVVELSFMIGAAPPSALYILEYQYNVVFDVTWLPVLGKG